MIMRDQRPKMNHTIFVKRDAIQIGNAGHVNQHLDAFADAALEFEDQIGRAGYDAGMLAVFRENIQDFIDGGCIYIVVPHTAFCTTKTKKGTEPF